jgi:hypothetical protein
MAFIAASRSVWMATKDPADESGRRRLFLPVKQNYADDTEGLAYQIDGRGGSPKIDWEPEPVRVNIDAVLSGSGASQLQRAQEWVREVLKKGPRLARDVLHEAEGEQIAEKTLRRALKAVGVEKRKEPRTGRSIWSLSQNKTRATKGADITNTKKGPSAGRADHTVSAKVSRIRPGRRPSRKIHRGAGANRSTTGSRGRRGGSEWRSSPSSRGSGRGGAP